MSDTAPHPCLVLVHDVCLIDMEDVRILYMVIEFCHGKKLLSNFNAGCDMLSVTRYHNDTSVRIVLGNYGRQWFAEVIFGLEHVHMDVCIAS